MIELGSERIRGAAPRLRGMLHAAAAPLALGAGVVLFVLSPTDGSRAGSAIFAASALANFSVSAALHRGHWHERTMAVIRRLDHASIFVLIAGSYTPFTILMLTGRDRVTLLATAWVGAALGIGFRLFWAAAPRWLYTVIYLVLGWAAIFFAGAFASYAGTAVPALMIAGGVLYTLGGIVYGIQRPNPSVRWFGFHEVFHALTVAAFFAHYVGVSIATYSLR
jgi:hemolysin III